MMSTPKRPASPKETRLWQQVTGDVMPLTGKRAAPAKQAPKSVPSAKSGAVPKPKPLAKAAMRYSDHTPWATKYCVIGKRKMLIASICEINQNNV